MIKMPKKITVILSLFCISLLFFSCTFMEETKTAKVSFSAGKLLKSNARSAITFEGEDIIEIRLLGDYTETQKITNIKENTKIIFAEVPLEAKVYAELIIYNKTPDNIKYSGKSDPIVVKEGDNILTVYVKAVKNEETENHENDDIEATYTVIHKVQNIDDDNYFEDESLRDKESGKAGSTTNAKAKEITGFTAQAFDQVEIKSDNSTEVIIYYDRNSYTVSYDDGVSDENITVPSAKEYRYDASINIDDSIPVRTGYDFICWKDSSGKIYEASSTLIITNSNITLMAQWTPSEGIMYTVKHLQQNMDDEDYTSYETENMSGKTSDLTKAIAKSYTGFTPQPVNQKTIAADGSTVVEIKYDRNQYILNYEDNIESEEIDVPSSYKYPYGKTVSIDFTNIGKRTGYTFAGWKDTGSGKLYSLDGMTSLVINTETITLYAQWTANTYTITYDLNNGSWAENFTAATNYIYGERQNLPGADKVVRTGYGLTGWTTEDGSKITEISADMTGDIKLIAQWAAGATNYQVHHWQQNIDDDEYTEVTADAQTLAGLSEELTNASANTYEGFTAKSFTQQTIQADGSTAVDIYYDRNTYEVSFDTMGGNTVASQTIRYEAKASEPEVPAKNGNSFLGWYTSSDGGENLSAEAFDFETPVTADITLYAKWSGAAVTVTVNAPDDESVEITCDSLTDPTAKELVFVIKNYVEGRSYKWYLDDKELTDSTPNFYIGGNTITMYNKEFAPGVYVISLSSGAYSSSLVVEISGN